VISSATLKEIKEREEAERNEKKAETARRRKESTRGRGRGRGRGAGGSRADRAAEQRDEELRDMEDNDDINFFNDE
jgi:hypothetical protein